MREGGKEGGRREREGRTGERGGEEREGRRGEGGEERREGGLTEAQLYS